MGVPVEDVDPYGVHINPPLNPNLSGSSVQKVVAFRATAFFIANNVKNLININEYVINFFVFLLKLKKKGVIMERKIVS